MLGIQIRYIVTRTIQVFVLCIANFAFYGCNRNDALHDAGLSENNLDGVVQVGFRVSLNEGYGTRAAETRADGTSLPPDYDDPAKYESGIGYENYIGIADNDFCFLLFDGNGKFMETMTVLGVFPVGGESGHASEYNVLCSLTKKTEGTFKVMVLANWGVGNYPQDADLAEGVTTIDDVCKGSIYAYTPVAGMPFTPSAETPIPMYGVKTCNMSLDAGRLNDIGDFYLLRAMAKVEVVCREGSGLELASVRLACYNTEGLRAPRGMDLNTSYVTEPSIPAGAVADEITPLDFHISADKGRAVIYIPEYRNTGTGRPCQLSVAFADNTERHYTVYFREYSNGKPTGERLDILRNCCYRFVIDKTAEFEVDLMPYGVVELDPGFGL